MTDLLRNIGWENAVEVWHVAILLMLLFVCLFWELRKKKPRKTWRTIALVLAFISLYIIYLSPYTLSEKPERSVVLLSKSISGKAVDSLKNQYDLPLLQEKANSKFQELGKAQLKTLSALDYQIDTAIVYGYFPQLNPKDFRHRKDIELEKGIRIEYPGSIALGDSLRLAIENLENRKLHVLAKMGNDSISRAIPSKGLSHVSTLPKSSGSILSEISLSDGNYNFATKVAGAERYVVQILAATPDFEWKFLGDYLKSKEHSVYQKTQISKDKFKLAFFNWHDSLQISRGVASGLKVLFSDAKAWEELGPGEKDRYLKELRENGGSLILRTSRNSRIELDLGKSKSTNIFSTSDNLLESENYKYLEFSNLNQLDEVLQNAVFRKVTSRLIYGVINFQNSYQLKLSGKNEQYEQIWSAVFKDLVRKSTDIFYDKSKWAVQYQPFFFRLWSADSIDEIIMVNLEGDTLNLKSEADDIYPERQHFMFYPEKTGWHFVGLKDRSEAIPFYVHSRAQADQSEFLSNYNQEYLNYLSFVDSSIRSKKGKYRQESVTLWFFMLFLLTVGYLWIEDKIT